jgi:iron(III) transport system permease protein
VPHAEHAGWRFDSRWVLIGVPVALVVWLAIVPLSFLVWQSFLTPHTAARPAEFTLENFRTAYLSAETFGLFVNSVVFATGTALFALVVGTVLAWMNERTNTPFKTLFFALSIIPLVIPGILFTVSWMLLASPKIGLLNVALQWLFGTDTVFFNIYSMAGMIWVDGLHYSPIAFLLMTAAFRSMDPSLEESAQMSGASILQIARRITFRLAWPAVLGSLLILFVRAIESFEVPALLGLPVGIHVYTRRSSRRSTISEPDRPASSHALTPLVLLRQFTAVAAVLPELALRPSPARAFARAPSTSVAGDGSRLRSSSSISWLSCCCHFWCWCGRRYRSITARRRGTR